MLLNKRCLFRSSIYHPKGLDLTTAPLKPVMSIKLTLHVFEQPGLALDEEAEDVDGALGVGGHTQLVRGRGDLHHMVPAVRPAQLLHAVRRPQRDLHCKFKHKQIQIKTNY